MKCNLCGTENDEHSRYCKSCGLKFIDNDDDLYKGSDETYAAEIVSEEELEKDEMIICPSCGSSNIHFVTIQSGSDYSAANGCCGFILFGPLGLLCGLLSNKRTATIRRCMNCSNEF